MAYIQALYHPLPHIVDVYKRQGYNNVGNGKAGTFENEQMYNYSRENKSETGMAYNQFAIASGYLAAREHQKAEP